MVLSKNGSSRVLPKEYELPLPQASYYIRYCFG